MTDKLVLKSSHEVIYTVDVADVESIFYCKPTDPDILTVLMKDGKRLYCDEVCPINSLQEEPVSEEFGVMADKYHKEVLIGECQMNDDMAGHCRLSYYLGLKDGAKWQKEQMMAKAVDAKLLEGHLIRQKGVTHPLHVGDKVKVIVIKEK